MYVELDCGNISLYRRQKMSVKIHHMYQNSHIPLFFIKWASAVTYVSVDQSSI